MIIGYTIDRTYKTQETLLYESLKNKAIAIFDLVVDLRHWNAEFNGVYAKTDKIQPNPYLNPNYILSDKNETLVWINPAFMTRQISDIASQRDGFTLKITSNKLINKHNAPDESEKKILNYFEENPNVPYYWKVDNDVFQFMGALKTEKACLQCHRKQGYREGDVRGGISVMFDAKKEFKKLEEIRNTQRQTLIYVVVAAIGTLITFLLYQSVKRKDERKISKLNSSLQTKVDELDLLNKNLHKKVNEEVAKLREKENMLIQQSKLAALGEMIGNIAHQWRQPINTVSTIMMNIKWTAISHGVKEDFLDDRIEEANEQLKYMSDTIEDFKNFFKPAKEKEYFTLEDEVQKAYQILQASLNFHNINVSITCQNEKPVYGYANEFSQVVLNIISNAKDVLISRAIKSPQIVIESFDTDKGTLCTIKDNGGGIDEKFIDKIFDPYFTTKEIEGTGIGLYICKEIIHKHMKGSLTVSFEDGMTVFKIFIPFPKEKNA